MDSNENCSALFCNTVVILFCCFLYSSDFCLFNLNEIAVTGSEQAKSGTELGPFHHTSKYKYSLSSYNLNSCEKSSREVRNRCTSKKYKTGTFNFEWHAAKIIFSGSFNSCQFALEKCLSS